MALGFRLLSLHAAANLSVTTLPDQAMLLLHVACLGIGIASQITICKRRRLISEILWD